MQSFWVCRSATALQHLTASLQKLHSDHISSSFFKIARPSSAILFQSMPLAELTNTEGDGAVALGSICQTVRLLDTNFVVLLEERIFLILHCSDPACC